MHSYFVPGAILLLSLSCASDPGAGIPPPDVVPQVDLSRYLGTWYEIASFPQRFQRGCEDTKAVYSLRADGTIEVLNSCFRNGKTDVAKGKAWVADKATNAKLKVSFFWPFRGDYWIIELGKDYDYAVVAGPSRNYLWILARSSTMDKDLYDAIVGRLKERGFDITKLRLTEHRIRS
jgi:apolipoprotein D and lipocalin family protein